MSNNVVIGQAAPLFISKDQNGNTVSLSDLKGQKVLLYFYPKDNTPGCTAQACNLRDNFSLLTQKNIVVLGVSVDDETSHKKFETKFNLPFTLIADTDKSIVNAYNLWGLKKFMGKEYMGTARTSFLINEEGIIEHIITKPKTDNHTEEVLELWNLL